MYPFNVIDDELLVLSYDSRQNHLTENVQTNIWFRPYAKNVSGRSPVTLNFVLTVGQFHAVESVE